MKGFFLRFRVLTIFYAGLFNRIPPGYGRYRPAQLGLSSQFLRVGKQQVHYWLPAGVKRRYPQSACSEWPHTAIPVHRDRCTTDSTVPPTQTKTVPLPGHRTNDVHKEERGKDWSLKIIAAIYKHFLYCFKTTGITLDSW